MNYVKAFQVFSILICSLSLCSFGLSAQTKESTRLEMKIDSIFKNFNDINKPGATVAVVKDNNVVFKKGYGSANLEYDIQIHHLQFSILPLFLNNLRYSPFYYWKKKGNYLSMMIFANSFPKYLILVKQLP